MATIANITFACDDPGALAEFWAGAIEYEVEDTPPGLLEVIESAGGDPNRAAAACDPDGSGPRLFFKKMPRSPTDNIPIHLDLRCDNREAEIDRLVELGATEVETKTQTTGPYTETWTVMEDPEGNGFCVQAPGQEE